MRTIWRCLALAVVLAAFGGGCGDPAFAQERREFDKATLLNVTANTGSVTSSTVRAPSWAKGAYLHWRRVSAAPGTAANFNFYIDMTPQAGGSARRWAGTANWDANAVDYYGWVLMPANTSVGQYAAASAAVSAVANVALPPEFTVTINRGSAQSLDWIVAIEWLN